MKKQYHVLNGDSLKSAFPESLQGSIVVARECFVDGDVTGKNLDELFVTRAKYLCQNYGETEKSYYKKAASEFLKLKEIQENSEINLWFEDDLFCQVNFWFVVNLLVKNNIMFEIFLVRPKIHTHYGFAGLKESELIFSYKDRIPLTDLTNISSLWDSYRNGNNKKLIHTAQKLEQTYPFILPAVIAHVDRFPENGDVGRPKKSLIAIMAELKTEDFGKVFREFNKREHIYGFGDIQVKRLFDEILSDRSL